LQRYLVILQSYLVILQSYLVILQSYLVILQHYLCYIAELVTDDPYDPDEPDPAKSRAMESCLWELKVCMNGSNSLHLYFPNVK